MSGSVHQREPKRTPLSTRIEAVLRYGLDPTCEVVSRKRALVFATDLILEHHLLTPRSQA